MTYHAICKKKPPLKILHVMSSLEHGGTEMRFLDLFRNAHGREYHFDVLIHHPLGNDFEQEIKENGGQILYCGKLRNIVSFAMRFNQLIKKGGYDVVHCHIPEFSAVCLAIARGRQVGKRIAHFHHIKPEKPSNSRRLIQHVLVQFILASASNIIGISKHVLNTWFGPAWQNNSKLQVVYDGIDFSDFAQKYDKTQFSNELGISVNKPIALHVGSFRPVKNHGLILSIAEKLKDIQFILVGDGPLRQTHENYVRDHQLSNVLFTGTRNDVARIMKCADALLFPSLHEGLGNVVIEALAADLPVVASRLPAIEEIYDICADIELIELSASLEKWTETLVGAIKNKNVRDHLRGLQNSPLSIQNNLDILLKMYSS